MKYLLANIKIFIRSSTLSRFESIGIVLSDYLKKAVFSKLKLEFEMDSNSL